MGTHPCARILCALCVLVGLSACGGDDGGDVKSPFGPVTETTSFGYQGTIPGIASTTFLGGIVGDKEIDGTTYKRLRIGYKATTMAELAVPDAKATEFWYRKTGDNVYEVAGFREQGGISMTLDTPLLLDALPAVGEPQTLVLTGTITHPDNPSPAPGTVTIEGSLVDAAAEVETKLGLVTGCRHYAGTITVTGEGAPAVIEGAEIEAEVWYHPELGGVAGSIPALGMDLGLAEESDLGDPDATSGPNAIRKVQTLDATTTRFELSTYDRRQDFDADKDTHSKMLLEMRWADEETAKTHAAPDPLMVDVEFGTVWGYFPHALIESSLSIFHPEENGKGFKYWYAYVDQAAKNESSNGIAYHIAVTKDATLPPLRVTARIRYNIWTE